MYTILLKEYSSMIVLVIIVLQSSLRRFNPKRRILTVTMSFYFSIDCFRLFTSPSNNANIFYAITFIYILKFPFTTNLFYILCFFIFMFLFWSKVTSIFWENTSLSKCSFLKTVLLFIVILYVDFRINSLFHHYVR